MFYLVNAEIARPSQIVDPDCMLLQIIMAKPAGGPKPRENRNADDDED